MTEQVVSGGEQTTMRHVWSGAAVADASEGQRVIDAANWIVGHAGWRALTNPAYVALLVVLTVALVGGADVIRIVAVGVVATLALPLATSRLAPRARRTLQARGEAP
jgi:hypothetical protein